MNLIQTLEKEQIDKLSAGKEFPDFGPGDTVLVNVKVIEGDKSRVQAYEGVCIGRAGGGLHQNFTVRKISYGEGVERVFPLYSPMIEFDQGRAPRQGASRQAVLSARPARQEGPHRRGDRHHRRRGRDRRVRSAVFSGRVFASPESMLRRAADHGFRARCFCAAAKPNGSYSLWPLKRLAI